MDDLTFRRTVTADPFTKDPEVARAAKADPLKQKYWDDIKAFNYDIESALDIDVPEQLAEKLLLKQSIDVEAKEQKRKPWYWAMAASLILAAVISLSILKQDTTTLMNDALAHVTHVEAEVAKYGPVDMQTVNAKLANYNGSVEKTIGNVVSANFCYLNEIKSLHLIIQGNSGLLSLFVLPQEVTQDVKATMASEKYKGMSFLLESTRVIVVGEDSSEIQSLADQAKLAMSFSV